jgi:hypothetical protein
MKIVGELWGVSTKKSIAPLLQEIQLWARINEHCEYSIPDKQTLYVNAI